MKATHLLRHNIRTLLRARGQHYADLAQWCHKSRAWLTKILKEDRDDPTDVRDFRLKELDRIADFFGLAAYQLFQPGISPLTERRAGHDRRSGRDRRIGHSGIATMQPASGLQLTANEALLVVNARKLKYEQWLHVTGWIDTALLSRGIQPDTALPPVQPEATASRARPTRHRRRS